MEVYHRLRIFENQNAKGDIEFPYISSSLDINIPSAGYSADLRYAVDDSIYDPETSMFNTTWKGLSSLGESQCLRLYLCSGISSVSTEADRTPHMLVSSSQEPTVYNTPSKPYNVSNDYYLSYCGLVEEYIDLSQSNIIPASLGYTHDDIKVTDYMLAAGLFTTVYGPYVRTLRYMNTYNIMSKNVNGPDIDIYHIGMSHWIDVSKLTPCDPAKYHIITGDDDKKAISTSGRALPNEFALIEEDSTSKNMSLNDYTYTIEHEYYSSDFWLDRRCNGCVIDAESETVGFRPEVDDSSCPEGYRVYVCSVFDNSVFGNNEGLNNEYRYLMEGTRWDWVNIQLWDGNKYLSADCFIMYSRGFHEPRVEFSNAHYFNGSSEVLNANAATEEAASRIHAVISMGHRMDIYVVVHNNNAVICTSELVSSMLYDNSWGYENDYCNSFREGGTRAEGPQSYDGSPNSITLQYKIYASTEVPTRENYEYTLYDWPIRDEYHYLTSHVIFFNMFGKIKYYEGDNDPYTRHIPSEMYTGIKWKNIEYDPTPSQE